MEDNRLLAEYLVLPHMEVKQSKTYGEYVTYADGQYKNVWRPDQDWNQLMMVVEKILKELDEAGDWCEKLHWGLAKADIVAVYNACVEYIKQKP